MYSDISNQFFSNMHKNIFTLDTELELAKPIKISGVKYKSKWKRPIAFSHHALNFKLCAYRRSGELVFLYQSYILGKWVYFISAGKPKIEEGIESMVHEYLSMRREYA